MARDIFKTIIKTAISNEEKGSRFYAKMARGTEDKKIKTIFEKLAREEEEHKSTFEKLLRHEIAQGMLEIPEKEAKLLETLVKTGVFHQMDNGGTEAKTPVEALAIGILAEKDSILLYQGIYNHTNSQVVRDMMSRLLEEEKMHLVELREQMEELSAGND